MAPLVSPPLLATSSAGRVLVLLPVVNTFLLLEDDGTFSIFGLPDILGIGTFLEGKFFWNVDLEFFAEFRKL
jgi:hypothetical protein